MHFLEDFGKRHGKTTGPGSSDSFWPFGPGACFIGETLLLPPWINASQHKDWAGQEKCSDVGHVVEAPLECIERETLSRIQPRQYFQHYGGIPYPHYGFENKPCHAEPMLASF